MKVGCLEHKIEFFSPLCKVTAVFFYLFHQILVHYCTFFKFLDGLLFNFLFHIFFSMSQEIIQLSKASHTFKMTYNNLIRLVSLTTFCRKHYQLVNVTLALIH